MVTASLLGAAIATSGENKCCLTARPKIAWIGFAKSLFGPDLVVHEA